MIQSSGRFTCFLVLFPLSVVFVIFSLFLQSFALHNVHIPSVSRYPNNRRTWRYQPPQYSRTLSPERLQRFRQMANPRRLSERRPTTIDTRRRFRQVDRTRDRRRYPAPQPRAPRTEFPQSRRLNNGAQRRRASQSQRTYTPRMDTQNIRKGRFSVAAPQNKVLHIRLKKNKPLVTNQVTPRTRSQGPLVYKTKPAYSPLVRSRTLAPKPSPKRVHRKEIRRNNNRLDSNKIGNFVVDLTKGVEAVTPNKPMVLVNNVKSPMNRDDSEIVAQGRFKIKKKSPSPPLVRPIVLPKPVTITQTPRVRVLSPSYVDPVPRISNIVPVPKLPKTPTMFIKSPPAVIKQNAIAPDMTNKQPTVVEPPIESRNDKKRPLFVLVRNPDGQFANSVIKIGRNGGDQLQRQADIRVQEKPFVAKASEMIDKQSVLVTNPDFRLPGELTNPEVQISGKNVELISKEVTKSETVIEQPVQATVTKTQNSSPDEQDIANFINRIRSGDINSLNLPPTVKSLLSPPITDQLQTIQQSVEPAVVLNPGFKNVSQLENPINKPTDGYNKNLQIIRDFVEQLKAGTGSLGESQSLISPGIINPTLQSGMLNQQMGVQGVMNAVPGPGLMNPYIPRVPPQFNPMSVRGWDGSSANVPLVMQQAGITHGSQLSAMMQEMLFGDSIDPPEPMATASSGTEIEIEGVPTTVKPRRKKRRRRKKKRRQRMRFRPTTEMPFMFTTPYSSFDFSGFDRVATEATTIPSSKVPTTTPFPTTITPFPATSAPIPTTLLPSTQSANDVAISLARRLLDLVNKGDSAASDIFKSLNIDIPQVENTATPPEQEKNQIPVDVSANEDKTASANEPMISIDQENIPQLEPQAPTEAVLESVGVSSENFENFQNIKDSLLSDVSLPGDSDMGSLSMSSFLSANDIGGVKIEKIQSEQKAVKEDESPPVVEPSVLTVSETLKGMKINGKINEDAPTVATPEQQFESITIETWDTAKKKESHEGMPTLATTEQPFEPITTDPRVMVKQESPEDIPTAATTEQTFESATIDFKEMVRSKLQRSDDEPLIAGLISIFNNFDSPSEIIRNVKESFVKTIPVETPTTSTTTSVPTTQKKTTTTRKSTTVRITKPTTTPTTKATTNMITTSQVYKNINIDHVLPKIPSDDISNNIINKLTPVAEDQAPKSPLEMLVGLLSELKSAIIPKPVEVPVEPATTPTTTTQAPRTTKVTSPTTTTTTTIQTPSKPITRPQRPSCTPFHPGFQCRGRDIFASVQNTGKWCVDTCRRKGCVMKVCDCNCNRQPPPNRLRGRGNPNWRRQNNWPTRRKDRRRGRNRQRKKPKPTTKEPPEEIEAEDMPQTTTTTEMMTTTDYYDVTYGFYSENSQTTLGYYSGNGNNGNMGEFLPQLDWASDPNLEVSRFNGNDQPGTTAAPNSEWMGPSRPPPSWRGTAWELPPAPIKKKKQQNSEGEEGTTARPRGWSPQPAGWSSGSNRQQGGWNQPPQNRWNNGPRFNGGSRDIWREPIGDGGRGSWNDPPPFRESGGDQWRRNMFGNRRSLDSGFRLRDSWRTSKSKGSNGSGGEEQET